MTGKIILFCVVIVIAVTGKVQCKLENIKFFLSNSETTKIISVPNRRPLQFMNLYDAEKSIQFKVFGKTFTLDLTVYYQRVDTEIDYISKLSNTSGTYLSSGFLLHYGFVRDVKDSYVLGFFHMNNFRGYVVTDEVYCIEPYGDSDSAIVYRFKDIIVPGCSEGTENLDCSQTWYFQPWKANKPPMQSFTQNYSLVYDKHLELINQLKLKKANEIRAKENKERTTHHPHVRHDKNTTKTKDRKKNEEVPRRTKPKEMIGDVENEDDDRFNIEGNVRYQMHPEDLNKISVNETSIHDSSNSRNFLNQFYKDVGSLWEESSYEASENLNSKQVMKNEDKDVINEPIAEALTEEENTKQCDLQVVVNQNFRSKFRDSDEIVLKDILTQFTLINKIFRKLHFLIRGKQSHLVFIVKKVIVYADNVYSAFESHGDLEYFTKKVLSGTKEYCLTVGLVEMFLKSGHLFDGYIPEGGGGACSKTGNTIIVSHGNKQTPAPMGLYFAALIRALTRALGSNDNDKACTEGSYPNPMEVLKTYLKEKEIKPSKQYSIFTSCNVKEIEEAIKSKTCFLDVSQPLCGNAILDPGEECDCGPSFKCAVIDPCCNSPHNLLDPKSTVSGKKIPKGCTLNEGSKCGDTQECCSGCDIDTVQSVCYSGYSACDIAMCDGKSAKCPTGVQASNGMICSEYDRKEPEPLVCKNNKCDQKLCTGAGLKPCICAPGKGKDCDYCCMKDGKCVAAGKDLKLVKGMKYTLPDGADCMGGTCVDGVCQLVGHHSQTYNFTYKKHPRLNVGASKGNRHSALSSILGTILSLLILRLL